jgi:carbamoyl-phosphate synthase small subunit
MFQNIPGFLLLEDDSIFSGLLFGFDLKDNNSAVGEICFNTSLSGYQEIITDPSYSNQIVNFTNPMLGNYGINNQDSESDSIHLRAVVCREYIHNYSNWRAETSLHEFLVKYKIPGLSAIDTRALTIKIRTMGALNGIIFSGIANEENIKNAEEQLKKFPGLSGRDLVKGVSCKKKYNYSDKLQRLPGAKDYQFKLAIIDCGVKFNILRCLDQEGFDITVYPADTPFKIIEDDGAKCYFISNGPGDPTPLKYISETVKEIIKSGKPLFGICLGEQIIALACGAGTYKMKFGHRGANQPVMDLNSRTIQITSHNHGFAVGTTEEKSTAIIEKYENSHVNLNDNCLEGIRLLDKNVMAVQYHPEAAPGPREAVSLFREFRELVENNYNKIKT